MDDDPGRLGSWFRYEEPSGEPPTPPNFAVAVLAGLLARHEQQEVAPKGLNFERLDLDGLDVQLYSADE